MDNNFTFSIGCYVKTPNEPLTTISLTFAKLIELFRTPAIITDKLKSPYFVRYAGHYRNSKTAPKWSSLLIIDADKRINWLNDGGELDGSIDPYPVHQCLKQYGINHFIYSSYSNGKIGADGERLIKWRLIIPCQYPQDRLTDCVNYIIALLHENHLFVADAKENHTYAQAWFMSCVHPDRAEFYQFFSFADGADLDIKAIPATQKALLSEQPERPTPRKPLATVPTNTHSPIQAFNELYTVHDILKRNSYKRDSNGKYLSPNSSSGLAGVSIMSGDDGIDRAFSHHNDALNNGKAHDAFNCYLLLECGGDYRRALNWNAELTRQNRRDYMKAKEFSNAGVV